MKIMLNYCEKRWIMEAGEVEKDEKNMMQHKLIYIHENNMG